MAALEYFAGDYTERPDRLMRAIAELEALGMDSKRLKFPALLREALDAAFDAGLLEVQSLIEAGNGCDGEDWVEPPAVPESQPSPREMRLGLGVRIDRFGRVEFRNYRQL